MMKVQQLDYHRNGVSGEGFHVGIVDFTEDGQQREILVIRFPREASSGGILCAAFDLSLLDQREIRFAHNSWRGDHFADVMDEAIQERKKERALYWEMEQAYRDLQAG